MGNRADNNTIIGGGGADSLTAGNGNDCIQGDVSQVVYVDFATLAQNRPNDHVYTPAEQQAILQGLNQDFAAFQQTGFGLAAGYIFTTDPTTAQQLAQTTGGRFVTLYFDAPVQGGAASRD